MNKIFLPNGMEASEAVYAETPILEYNSNPYIQALPPIKNKEDIIKSLMINQPFDVNERNLDSSIRVHLIQRIYKVFQPLPIHIRVWNTIDTLIRQGYVARNPFSKEYRRFVNETGKQIINRTFDINSRTNFRTTASCGLLIGFSGMGKSTVTNLTVSSIPQIICHNEYNSMNFNQIQLPWLKLEAPFNSSPKALAHQFFMKIDELLGTDNFKRSISRNLSTDSMMSLMGAVANNIGLGLLIIDELQNLNRGGTSQIMNFLVSLINLFGVPILFIGTPASYDIFQSELRISRRVTGNGEIIWNNMDNNEEFKLLLKGLWRYQWTQKQVSLTDEMIDLIYFHTQGISDLVVKLFVNCQYLAITTGKEEITKELVSKVAEQEFKLMKSMIEAIRSGNPYKTQQYEDIRRLGVKCVARESVNNNLKLAKEDEKVIKDKTINKLNDKRKSIKINSLSDDDLRKCIHEGKVKGKGPHDVLNENGYIDSLVLFQEDDKL
jgi:hypothetical protein